MSAILFGIFSLVGKRHTVSKDKTEKYRLIFEDEEENRLTVTVPGATYEIFKIADPLPWKMVKAQRTLEEAKA